MGRRRSYHQYGSTDYNLQAPDGFRVLGFLGAKVDFYDYFSTNSNKKTKSINLLYIKDQTGMDVY